MSLSTRKLLEEFDKQWEHGLEPDVGEFVDAQDSLSPSQLAQVLLIDQSRRWAGGDKVSASDYFKQFPELLNNPEAAIDLIFAEFLLREEAEATISVDGFANRYPQFAEELQRQIVFHRTIGAELLHDNSYPATDARTSRSVGTNEVPGYEILGELGRGGLGVVYLARDVQLNRKVALKMLLAGKFASTNLLKRLLLEAEATARLQHPNIVQIYKVGQHEGHPFLALEYINGGTLSQWMERRPQSPRDAANIIREVALAIQFAHENGVIHRDVKPSNLLLQVPTQARTVGNDADSADSFDGRFASAGLSYADFRIKVADFGLAKLVESGASATLLPTTMTGDMLGTAAYMSPEQALGGSGRQGALQLNATTDIYSLGAILYELLTGRPPFVGVQPLEVLNQVITDEPVRPSQLVRNIPKDLQTICLKCLEKSPARRYPSAAALADDLQRFLSNRPIVGRRTMIIERGWRWCRRNPVKTTLAALVASLLLMVASVSSVYSFMLTNQLAITTQSEFNEKALKMRALDQLWESSVSQADALRTSRQVGQRFESLQAIETARELGRSIQFEPNQIDRMRNATIAALALSDLRIVHQWKRTWPKSAYLQSFDKPLTVCAYMLEQNLAVVQRISDGVELARIENVVPESKLLLSPDGSKLAIVKDQCRVYKLNTTSHELLFESTSNGPWAFSEDGTQLIGTDGEGQLKLVDFANSLSIKTMGEFRGQKQISMSPDSRQVAMWIDQSVQVVELDTGKVILRVAPPIHPPWQLFEWHPNSKILAVGAYTSGVIELWDVGGGERLKNIPAVGPCWFHFDVKGARLLVYSVWSEDLRLWDAVTGEQEFSQKGQPVISMSPDSAGGFTLIQSHDSEHVARVNISSPTVYRTIPAMRKDSALHGVSDLSYSPDGQFLAYSSRNEFEIFDADTMASLARKICPACYLRFDADGSLLTSSEFGIDKDGYRERGLNRWQYSKSKGSDSVREVNFGPPKVIYDPRRAFANAPFEVGFDGKTIAVPTDDGVSIWSTEQGKSIRSQATHADVRRVSINPDGKRVASGGWNSGNVCIWDAHTGQLQHTIHDPQECTVQFSPDGKLLATNSSDITIWETHTWKELYKVQVLGQPNSGVSVCFSPDSKTIAASDSLGRIHLIDSRRGQEYLLLIGPTEKQINALHYSPDGRQLAVLPGGDTAHVWNLDAIQEELDARNLGWQTGEGIVPQVKGDGEPARHASKTVAASLPKVDILFDERFRQMEAIEHIGQAVAAAANLELDAARVAIARAVALNPQDPRACNNFAWLLATGPVQLRDTEKAIELAMTAMQNVEESKRSLYANTLGVAQFRAGNFEDALEMLKQSLAIQIPESQPFDLYFLSMCSAKLGDHDAAREYFDRAEQLKAKYRSQLPFKDQAELEEFSKEAKALMNQSESQIPRGASAAVKEQT